MLQVARRGGTAVHVLDTAIPEGTVANVRIDWKRRFDHMQQHSGMQYVCYDFPSRRPAIIWPLQLFLILLCLTQGKNPRSAEACLAEHVCGFTQC